MEGRIVDDLCIKQYNELKNNQLCRNTDDVPNEERYFYMRKE